MSQDDSTQNDLVLRWSNLVQRNLRTSASRFHKGKDGTITRPGRIEKRLATSPKTTTKKDYGIIDRISFSFERHGVFVQKGVGRGYQMSAGAVTRTAKQPIPDPGPRYPADWFNSIMAQNLPELADKLAEINADAVVNATRMLIR